MPYTYDDFLKAANDAGRLGEFSQADLDTAQKYPEFGMSILSLKNDYHGASTAEQKALANEAANQLRSSYANYTGSGYGGQYYSNGKVPGMIDDTLEKMNNYGPFSWSKETDPLWGSYKKSYLREGDRATSNALAQASAASGGRPSSYAVNAATQAGNYYATKLNDVIPQLYNQAYGQYMDDYARLQSNLAALQSQDAVDYSRYQDDLNWKWMTDQRDYERAWNEDERAYNRAWNEDDRAYNRAWNEDDRAYNRAWNEDDRSYNRAWNEDERSYSRTQDDRKLAQAQVDAILQAGGMPSADLINQAGYSNAYVQALRNAWLMQNGSGGSAGGGGSSGGRRSSGGGSGNWYDTGLDDWYSTGTAGGGTGSTGTNWAQYGSRGPWMSGSNYSTIRSQVLQNVGNNGSVMEATKSLKQAKNGGLITEQQYQTLLAEVQQAARASTQ